MKIKSSKIFYLFTGLQSFLAFLATRLHFLQIKLAESQTLSTYSFGDNLQRFLLILIPLYFSFDMP